ncbi:Melanocyte protein PMEL 115 kDa melanosomal matrix protein [Triplophysa tibetana]|uniref:Melanocyte protein PMEL 115 kDa melanosomal matrix protein n=1 Tax=Triplophysa tibetana TaxID=1572043 RepID=A0A5A9NDN7_9TELE|nr:Melanocyte protein PMEL 115 kDa melanosomal matrix protein [Triplophysa tibetana]
MRKIVLALLLTLSFTPSESRNRFSRYRSWNSHLYPVWRDGDPRYRDCWTGGEVTFKVRSDSPTLTGAQTTFNIDVQFPQNQTVLPDGQVVWARNSTINGTAYTVGQAVYPEPNAPQEWTGVFPDGTPFTKISSQKPRFIYVWKTWGKYWQVADGPSSLMTIDTSREPVGSYTMEVVIYHCRGKNKFIPLGYASVQFSITDQIPFAVTLSQVGDITQGDQSFIQNTAVSFSINLHDPSHYLSGSDITFNWDFGDNSGTLISRDAIVTHTYLTSGSFRPQVLLMAAILSDCTPNPTSAVITVTPAPDTGDLPASSILPDEDDVVSVESVVMVEQAADEATVASNELAVAAGTEAEVNAVGAQEEEPTVNAVVAEASTIITNEPVTEFSVSEASTSVPAAEGDEVIINMSATLLPESPAAATATTAAAAAAVAAAAVTETVTPVNVLSTDAVASVIPAAEDTDIISEATAETNGATQATDSSVSEATVSETVTDATQPTLVIAKRQAPEMPADTCLIYRYGSYSTSIDVVQRIESVEIVEVNNVVTTELEQNAVDLTVTCQGSLPNQVCTVVSDADCISPVQTLCTAVTPTPECQMVLRQFFNDSGTFCINVSLTNDVSLAVTSAKVSVNVGTSSSRQTAGAALGLLLFICAVGAVAFTYRRSMRADYRNGNKSSVSLMLWNLVSRPSVGESRPLLHGPVV